MSMKVEDHSINVREDLIKNVAKRSNGLGFNSNQLPTYKSLAPKLLVNDIRRQIGLKSLYSIECYY